MRASNQDATSYGAPDEGSRMPDQPTPAFQGAFHNQIPMQPSQAQHASSSHQPQEQMGAQFTAQQGSQVPMQASLRQEGASIAQPSTHASSIQASAASDPRPIGSMGSHAGASAQPSSAPEKGRRGSRRNGTGDAAMATQARPRSGSSIAWPIALIISIALISTAMLFSAISCSNSFNDTMSSLGLGKTTQVEDSSPKIGVISIASSIAYDGSECSPTGLGKLLDKAASDNSIKGIILWVNSGGGTATAGEEMAAAVRDFEKPIVVVSGATNASAAYEISSQADRIFVGKTTAIGSIGVVLQVTDLSGLYDKLGIRIDNITSADSKDATYGSRPLTDEEREWYQDMVDQISDDFIETVAKGRDMTVEEVRELANGMTYTGTDAVDNGLADSIGYLDDAIAYLSELAGYASPLKAHTLYLGTSSSIADLISILGKDPSGGSDLIDQLRSLDGEAIKVD